MTDTATPAIDWTALGVEDVAQLAPSKVIEDIPAPIRAICDAALKDKAVKNVSGLTGVTRPVFEREARDYCFLHSPRLTLRVKRLGDTGLRLTVVEYVAPKK